MTSVYGAGGLAPQEKNWGFLYKHLLGGGREIKKSRQKKPVENLVRAQEAVFRSGAGGTDKRSEKGFV